MLVLPALLYSIINTNNVYADTASSISISISGGVNLDLMPTDTTGTFAKSSEQTITVTSNHYSGYTLSIVGQDNTRQLKSTVSGSSNVLTSTTSAITESTFSSSSSTSYNGKWGFYPSKYGSSNNTYYRPGPTTSATILDNNTTIPSESGTSTNYTLAIGARANTNTPKEPYAAKFTITAVGNAPRYTVNYYSTTGTPTNMPSTTSGYMSGYMSGRNINVSASIPTRTDNYEFIGWCTISTNNENCSGQTLQPNVTYTFSDINYKSNNILNLYAIWDEKLPYMQDVLDWEDQIPNTGDQMRVKDKRDNKKYWVGRQADGNIWMTQNLDFEITSEPLTSDTSDLTAYNTGGYTSAAGYTQVNGITKWTPAETAITANSVTPVSTSTGKVADLTGWTDDNAVPYSSEGGDVYVYTSASTNADTIYTSLADCVAASHTETECKHYHRGNYYNWNAAVASNNTNVTELGTNYTTAQNSICPAGWRLPVGAKANSFSQTNTEFAYLLKQTGIFTSYPSSITNSASYATNGFNNIRSNPLFFVRSGYVGSTSLYGSGTYGHYWSSSVYSSTVAYGLDFYSSIVNPAYNYNRGYGFSVRCVARPKTMQNVAEWGGKLEVGEQTTAVDERDGKRYFVAKQADGNIWMTQNLDFEITSTSLTSDTSDLTIYNTGAYTSSGGYSKNGNIIKWTPSSTSATSNVLVPVSTATGTISGLSGWVNDNYTPYSAEGGDVYVYTSGSTSTDSVYTSLSSCIAASHTEAECKHYHRGNYYNWSATVASNNTNVTELNTNYDTAGNSICPAGWKLPVAAKSNEFSQSNTEFAYLLKTSNIFSNYPSALTDGVAYTTDGFSKLRNSPFYFVRNGHVYDNTLWGVGGAAYYWSSSANDTYNSYAFRFLSTNSYPVDYYSRDRGFAIRCVARRTMQNVTDWANDVKVGEQVTATDVRDGKEYTVARQADGNIWMTQNLDFEITSEPLTSDTSDLTAYNTGGYTFAAGYTQENGVIKWTPAATAITSGRTVPVSTSTGDVSGLTNWANDYYAPYSAEGGDVYVYTSANTNADTVYTSLSSCTAASHTEAECKHYHRGNYYNWSAAIANNSTNVTELTTSYNTATNSICPAGWRLPVGQNASSQNAMQFGNLMYTSGINTSVSSTSYATNGFNNIRSNPLFFVRSGYVSSTSLYSSGTLGYYWSSSVYNSTIAYYLYFSSSNVNPANNNSRTNGFSVRCVARRTMQNVANWADSLETGQQVTATDVRDGKEYTVAKQADGNIWMTQNLDFEITGEPLTSETSDLTAYGTGTGYETTAGYTQENGIIKWTPASTAITSGRTVPVSTKTDTVDGVIGWGTEYFFPYSVEGGDAYVYTSSSTNVDTIYTSLSSCIAASHTEAQCKHYHRGNYYNWSAAVASNNTNVTELTTNYNTAANSICPTGWRLPIGAKAGTFSQENTELAYLLKQTNIFTDYPTVIATKSTSYTTNGLNNVRSNPLFFVRSGNIHSTSLYNSGTIGSYLSSSVYDAYYVYDLSFNNSSVYPVAKSNRYGGYSVRCVAR